MSTCGLLFEVETVVGCCRHGEGEIQEGVAVDVREGGGWLFFDHWQVLSFLSGFGFGGALHVLAATVAIEGRLRFFFLDCGQCLAFTFPIFLIPKLVLLASLFLFHLAKHPGIEQLLLFPGTLFRLTIGMFAPEAEFTDVLVAAGTLLGRFWLTLPLTKCPFVFAEQVLEFVFLGGEGADIFVDLLHLSPKIFHDLPVIPRQIHFLPSKFLVIAETECGQFCPDCKMVDVAEGGLLGVISGGWRREGGIEGQFADLKSIIVFFRFH